MIAGLLLAAGGSRRFGSQKLITLLDGAPLVRHAAGVLIAITDCATAIVGSDATAVRKALTGLPLTLVENADWASGLASSLRSGIQALPTEAEAVVVMLGDQPRVETAVARSVIARWRESDCAIVAARYVGVQGHPVLFSRQAFGDLLTVDGDRGAQQLIARIPRRVAYVDVATPAPSDVDTPQELARLAN